MHGDPTSLACVAIDEVCVALVESYDKAVADREILVLHAHHIQVTNESSFGAEDIKLNSVTKVVVEKVEVKDCSEVAEATNQHQGDLTASVELDLMDQPLCDGDAGMDAAVRVRLDAEAAFVTTATEPVAGTGAPAPAAVEEKKKIAVEVSGVWLKMDQAKMDRVAPFLDDYAKSSNTPVQATVTNCGVVLEQGERGDGDDSYGELRREWSGGVHDSDDAADVLAVARDNATEETHKKPAKLPPQVTISSVTVMLDDKGAVTVRPADHKSGCTSSGSGNAEGEQSETVRVLRERVKQLEAAQRADRGELK